MADMDYEIEIKELEAQKGVAIREKTTAKELGSVMPGLYPEVLAYLEKKGVRPAGPSFGVYHTYTEDEVDFQAGFLVTDPVEGEGRIEAIILPGGRAAVTTHVGPYTTIGKAHEAMDEFVHGKEHEHRGSPWEVYVVGPGDEPDSAKWRTEVIYPF
jgi:effector-binding domain-containing protein